VRWKLLLGAGSSWQTTRAIYAGLFVNEIVPFRPGEAIRAWLAARELKIGLWRVFPTLVAERLMDGAWLIAALSLALAVAPLPASVVRAMCVLAAVLALLGLLAWRLGGTRFALVSKVRSGLRNHRALLGTVIPLAPGNLGAHQFSTVLALSLFGVPRTEAAGFSIVVFTILTAPLMVIGFFACMSAGVTRRDIGRRYPEPVPGGGPVPAFEFVEGR
jgi:hypothetical protein